MTKGSDLSLSIGMHHKSWPEPTADFSGENWRVGSKISSTTLSSLPSNFADFITGENVNNSPVPTPVCSVTAPSTPVKVDHWTQEWRIGSLTAGDGVRVQIDTLQRFNEHAEHDDILTGNKVAP